MLTYWNFNHNKNLVFQKNEFETDIRKKAAIMFRYQCVESFLNTLRQRQNGRHFADDIFKCIFLNENVYFSNKILLNFVPKGPINNIPALVQIMAWRRPGDKPLFEPTMVTLLTHICVTRPQWVNKLTKAQSQVQLGLQPNCSNTCQVWTWYSTDKQLFYIIQNREKFMIWGNWFSNPLPWTYPNNHYYNFINP